MSLEQLNMQQQKYSKYLLTIQLCGAVMFGIVCAAYILGLPSDTVLHGELAFRIAIGFFGILFFAGSIAMLAVAYAKRRRL